MNFQGFVGPTYLLRSVNADCQRCVNLFPERIESGTGKEGAPFYYTTTPGLTKLLTVGTGPIRCIHVDFDGRVFVVSGNTVFWFTYSGGVWSSTSFAVTLTTSTGIVRAKSFNPGQDRVTVFVDGVHTYLFWHHIDGFGVPSDNFNTILGFGYPEVAGATHVDYIDGFIIFNKGGSNLFYVTTWNTISVDPLSFAAAEGDPSSIVGLIANNRLLCLLSQRTAEVWQDVGNADFPFERISGGFLENGCVAPYSIAKIGGSVFWLGRDEFGQGMVFMASGLSPQKVSTNAVDTAINSYASMASATAFTYQSNGHSFYVLNFAEATWVYDLSTNMWHERAYTNPLTGNFERHRADVHCFIPQYGIHMVGDYANGNVYQYGDAVYTDNGDAITRMRAAPHISAGGKRVFCSLLEIQMETGIGLDGGVQGSDPQVVLDWSDDMGHTWSSETWAAADGAAGQIGQYKTRVRFRRLGSFRDRVFRIKITDPVKVAITGAQIELEPGAS